MLPLPILSNKGRGGGVYTQKGGLEGGSRLLLGYPPLLGRGAPFLAILDPPPLYTGTFGVHKVSREWFRGGPGRSRGLKRGLGTRNWGLGSLIVELYTILYMYNYVSSRYAYINILCSLYLLTHITTVCILFMYYSYLYRNILYYIVYSFY